MKSLRNLLGGDARPKEVLKEITRTPEFTKILNADEQRDIERRRELLKRREVIRAEYENPIAEAAEAAEAARLAMEVAQGKFHEAKREYNEKVQLSYGIWLARERELADVYRELTAGRDPRLDACLIYLGDLDSSARCSTQTWPISESNRFGALETRIENNGAAVGTARAALAAARGAVESLATESVTFADVTARLGSIFSTLAAPLAAINLAPPSLGDDDEVLAPSYRSPTARERAERETASR